MSTADVARNKAAIIERCVRRTREVYGGDDVNLTDDVTKQDSIILNIQRACEASVDLAMHLVRKHHLGIPQDSRHAFDLLAEARKVDRRLADVLKRMVGFRNVVTQPSTTWTRCVAPSSASSIAAPPASTWSSSSTRDTPRATLRGFSTRIS